MSDENQSTENGVEADIEESGREETTSEQATETKGENSGTGAKAPDEVFCTSCGEAIKEEAEMCPNCGVRQQGSAGAALAPHEQKNPGIAAVASFFFAGLGQIYNGQIGKGILLIVVQMINVGLMFLLIGFATYPLVWIYGMYDAYKTAERINRGEITP